MALVGFRAPALPLPPGQYDSRQQAELIRALRLYFNLIDSLTPQQAQSYKAENFIGGTFTGDFVGDFTGGTFSGNVLGGTLSGFGLGLEVRFCWGFYWWYIQWKCFRGYAVWVRAWVRSPLRSVNVGSGPGQCRCDFREHCHPKPNNSKRRDQCRK